MPDRFETIRTELEGILDELAIPNIRIEEARCNGERFLTLVPSTEGAAELFVHDGGDPWTDFGIDEAPSV